MESRGDPGKPLSRKGVVVVKVGVEKIAENLETEDQRQCSLAIAIDFSLYRLQ